MSITYIDARVFDGDVYVVTIDDQDITDTYTFPVDEALTSTENLIKVVNHVLKEEQR